MKWNNNKKGFTILEIIVAIAIIIIAFVAILGFFIFDTKVAERGRMRLKALFLAEESVEAIRNFRDNNDWNISGIGSLVPDTDYHPASISVGWDIVLGNENIDGFTRTVIFNRVSRDVNDNIESSYNPINDDPETRKITVTVNWVDRQGSAGESLTTYITNWKE